MYSKDTVQVLGLGGHMHSLSTLDFCEICIYHLSKNTFQCLLLMFKAIKIHEPGFRIHYADVSLTGGLQFTV